MGSQLGCNGIFETQKSLDFLAFFHGFLGTRQRRECLLLHWDDLKVMLTWLNALICDVSSGGFYMFKVLESGFLSKKFMGVFMC
jgi:hypothetical protein